jgi:hypothetical protein
LRVNIIYYPAAAAVIAHRQFKQRVDIFHAPPKFNLDIII